MTAPSQPSNFTVGRRLYKVNDFNHYPMPVVPKPALGIPFTDPVFGATITRLTDISQSPKVADMYRAYTGYPKHNIENADRSKLLLQAYPVETQWDVYPNICPIDVIHPIAYVPYAFDIGAPIDFRWDNADPYVYYFQYGCKMWQGSIQTGEVKTLYDFTSFMKEQFPTATYVDISMKEEGDASDDRRWWAFLACTYYGGDWQYEGIILYDKVNNRIANFLKRNWTYDVNTTFSSVSPKGNYVWVGDYLRYYTIPDLQFVGWSGLNCHADFAISREGYECVVGNSWRNDTAYWFAAERCDKPGKANLSYISLCGGRGDSELHVSGNNHKSPGWCVISKYQRTEDRFWGDNEIILAEVRFDRQPNFLRLAHHHVISPQAKSNMAGDRVYFTSNWGSGIYHDAYKIDITPDILGALMA